MRGLAAVCHTVRGGRPGDPLGDFVLGMLANRVMRQIQSKIAEADLALVVPWDGRASPFGSPGQVCLSIMDISCVYDAVFPLVPVGA